MKKNFVFAFLLIAFGFYLSCSTIEETASLRPGVTPPFKSLDVENTAFVVDAAGDVTLTHPSGTQIKIPANCFVDSLGKPVTGEVNIDYREFHTAADIIAAGIPMHYDSGGVLYDFVTAGMFEINANQGVQELEIADGKSIDVEFASYTKDPGYNNYFWDPIENNWIYLGEENLSENAERNAGLEKIEKERVPMPYKPVPYSPEDYTFDLNINYKQFPELATLNGLMWQYAGNKADEDPKNNVWISKERWTDVILKRTGEKEGLFSLLLANSKKKFETIVHPVLRGRALKNAQKEYNKVFEVFNKQYEEERRLRKQAEVRRAFSINRMGLFNCDYFSRRGNMSILASVDFGEEINLTLNPVTIFQVTANDRGVLQNQPMGQEYGFRYFPDQKNKLMAVLPGDKIVSLSAEEFSKQTSGLGSDDQVVLKMKPAPENITSLEQLDELIAAL